MFKKIHKILLWALLLAVLLTACKAKSSPGPAATPTLTPYPTLDPELLGRIQEDRALKEKFQDIKRRNPALSSVVNEFIIKYQREGHDAAIEWAREQQLLDPEDNVAITVILDTKDTAIIQDFVTKAEGYGCIVLGYLGNEVEILIPLSVIETYAGSEDSDSIFDDLATLDHVETIKFTAYLGTMGGIESEGVGVIGADQWHEQGYRGQNVKVGIIDYGFDGYRDLLGTELPTSVTAQSFVYYSDVDNTGNEHGTAVAEIIYDVAPDAELYFARIDGGASCFAKAARWLADQGVAIINHSGGYPFGPFDGTNPRDALVDEITARDILWLNSAGNDGEAHWRGMFEDTDGDGFHNFAPNVNRIPIWGQRGVQLHWWNNPGEDYDIYVYNKNDWVMAKSLDDQKSGASPMEETARFPMIRGINYYVAIKAEQDAQPVMVDLFVSNGMIQDATYVVREHSVTNPGTAKTALSVGATWWSDDAITTYSSGGPTEDGRLKPEISAPAEVDNVTYSVEGFGGTSAASPHVAGAAALVLSAYSEMSAQDLKTYLLDHALDLGPSGADNVYGYGRVDLPPQGEVATDSTPTPEATDSDAILTATTTPPAPTDTTATPVTVATATSKRDERLLSTASAIVETKVLPTAKSFATEVAPTVDAFVTEILPTVVEKATEIGPTVRAIAHTDTPVPESSDEPTSEDSLWVSIVVIAIVVLILAIAIMWVLFKQPRPQSAQPPSPTPSAPAYYPVQPPATPPTVQAPVMYLVSDKGQRYPLLPGFNSIGRASGCTIHVPDTQMSRQHATFQVSVHEVIVEDTSTNGTFINTRRISGPTRLQVHDCLRCGNTAFTLLSQDPQVDNIHPPSRPQAFLQIKGRERIPLATRDAFTIGRSSQNDIALKDEKVSRQHARLEWRNGRLYLQDLHSSGGTWVNGQPIAQCWLQGGDTIQMGNTVLMLII